VVCAIDITEDLSVGLDCMQLMNELDASNDPRIFYLIHDHQIDNSDDTRTEYDGPNAHEKHMHISVKWDVPRRSSTTAGKWNDPDAGRLGSRPTSGAALADPGPDDARARPREHPALAGLVQLLPVPAGPAADHQAPLSRRASARRPRPH
jgi:hypothetical protein